MFIDINDPEIEKKLLSQERIYDRIRMTGVEAPAKIISVTDTGIRIGENASMLQFKIEVFPKNDQTFEANTQQSVSDISRPKFAPGMTIYVKYDPNDIKQVAMDHAPIETPNRSVKCSSCGATQIFSEGQTTCTFCGSPLSG
jgi:hypothetical protein